MPTRRAPLSNAERGDQTRQQILRTALPIVARAGGRGVSVAEIAAAAGVSKTNLLHHFNSKSELLSAILDVRDEIDNYPHGFDGASGTEALDRLVDGVREWATRPQSIGVFTMLLIENLNDSDPMHGRLLERANVIRAGIAGALERGKADGTIRDDISTDAIAAEVIAFINGLETYWLLDPTVPVVEIAEGWRDALARRLGTQEQTPAAVPLSPAAT